MKYLFIIASATINYVKDGVNRQLYKILAKDAEGKQFEVVSSSDPGNHAVAMALPIKKGQPLWKNGPKAEEDTLQVQYYTSTEQVAAAKQAFASIKELEW